jgi:peptidoglycan/xylan/chitin deacetylase (PgdA/CDA1 family)
MVKMDWPDRKKFGVFLSHDVDRIRKTYQFFTHFIIERRFYHLISIFQKPNPYWCFEKIMDMEKKYDVRSTFFFLQESKKFEILKPSNYFLSLGKYSFNEPAVCQIIKKLEDDGFDIGLHGSYESYKNKDLLFKEKQELEKVIGKPVIGIRQHHLNLEVPITWEIQREIGFYYDASYGYKDKIGYRDDRIEPFKPFNDKFLVVPLPVMDGVVFSMYNNDMVRWEKIKELIDVTEKKGGLISFLWHQRVFNEKEFPGWSKMYEKIIIECKKRNAWFGTGREIWEMWKNDH